MVAVVGPNVGFTTNNVVLVVLHAPVLPITVKRVEEGADTTILEPDRGPGNQV
jgi:hypothetical protein